MGDIVDAFVQTVKLPCQIVKAVGDFKKERKRRKSEKQQSQGDEAARRSRSKSGNSTASLQAAAYPTPSQHPALRGVNSDSAAISIPDVPGSHTTRNDLNSEFGSMDSFGSFTSVGLEPTAPPYDEVDASESNNSVAVSHYNIRPDDNPPPSYEESQMAYRLPV